MFCYKILLRKAGVDSAVSYLLISKILSLIFQPLIIYLIATRFSPALQGFYYTFVSLSSAYIIFEFGLGMIITQYASHEFASLHWSNGHLDGDSKSLSRILSLLKKAVIWYIVFSGLFILIVVPFGLIFFSSNSESIQVDFVLPWIILVICTSVTLFISPFTAVLEGSGKITEMQKMKLCQTGLGVFLVSLLVSLGGNLYTAAMFPAAYIIIASLWFSLKYKGLVNQIIQSKKDDEDQFSWKKELMPMQWRIALSYISGFLTFQLVTPCIFHYQNAEAAGQMGMTIYVCGIALNTGMVWLVTKVPIYGAMIKNKNYNMLDQLAYTSTMRSLLFTGMFSVIGLIVICFIKENYPHFGERVLSVPAISAMLLSNFIIILTNSMASYLRAYKEEPLLYTSLIHAVITVLAIWYTARYYNADVLAYVLLLVNLFVNMPLVSYVFIKKRKERYAN